MKTLSTWVGKNRMMLAAQVLCGAAALTLWGCSSGQDITETTYLGGMETDQAVVQATPNGGYRTVSGDPYVVANDNIENESMLPYGAGNEGIRQAEDEDPNAAFEDGNGQ